MTQDPAFQDAPPALDGAVSTAEPGALSPAEPGVTPLGVLELREEVIEIRRERRSAGAISFRREVQTRTETVTTELRREVLIIETQPGGPEVLLDGEVLQPGETREVVLYDEQTVVSKAPFVTEEVRIGRRAVVSTQQQDIELRHEVLVVDEEPPTPA